MKSIVVYDIPSDARWTDLQKIAEHFGLKPVPGVFGPRISLMANQNGHLYYLYGKLTKFMKESFDCRTFKSCAEAYNRSIPLTDWASGAPPCVGEWVASVAFENKTKRWWDGNSWSNAYSDEYSDEQKQMARRVKRAGNEVGVMWRGLSSQPITAGFAK